MTARLFATRSNIFSKVIEQCRHCSLGNIPQTVSRAATAFRKKFRLSLTAKKQNTALVAVFCFFMVFVDSNVSIRKRESSVRRSVPKRLRIFLKLPCFVVLILKMKKLTYFFNRSISDLCFASVSFLKLEISSFSFGASISISSSSRKNCARVIPKALHMLCKVSILGGAPLFDIEVKVD